MSVLRAVADTNVLVAAAISPRGTCGRLLDAALEKRWTLVASPQLIAEFGEVLFREKFRSWLPEDEASRFVADIRTLADVVADPPDAGAAVTADPKDEFLVALAQAADVAALISGDPHLTNLKNLERRFSPRPRSSISYQTSRTRVHEQTDPDRAPRGRADAG